MFHDFGKVPHGQVATTRLAIDFPQDRGAIIPLGYSGNCSCATPRFVAIGKDGKERISLGRASPEHAVFPGEALFLELNIDTKRKEATDQQAVSIAGEQPREDEPGELSGFFHVSPRKTVWDYGARLASAAGTRTRRKPTVLRPDAAAGARHRRAAVRQPGPW